MVVLVSTNQAPEGFVKKCLVLFLCQLPQYSDKTAVYFLFCRKEGEHWLGLRNLESTL
jgi:hypothetical protein